MITTLATSQFFSFKKKHCKRHDYFSTEREHGEASKQCAAPEHLGCWFVGTGPKTGSIAGGCPKGQVPTVFGSPPSWAIVNQHAPAHHESW
jgi:hypothetical protein